jgi:hypothetical protein
MKIWNVEGGGGDGNEKRNMDDSCAWTIIK